MRDLSRAGGEAYEKEGPIPECYVTSSYRHSARRDPAWLSAMPSEIDEVGGYDPTATTGCLILTDVKFDVRKRGGDRGLAVDTCLILSYPARFSCRGYKQVPLRESV